MKKQTSEVISRESLVNELKRVLNLGLDVHYRPGIEWLRGDFQNVARWEPGHRLEAYACYISLSAWLPLVRGPPWQVLLKHRFTPRKANVA
jgi:hypothetical protein